MKRLIQCNTYYQLLVAMRMKETIFRNDEVIAIITDSPSEDVKKVYIKLRGQGWFNQIFFLELKDEFEKKGIMGKYELINNCSYGLNGYIRSVLGNLTVDEFIFNGIGYGTIGLYAYLYKFNNRLVPSMMEEGIAVYDWFKKDVYTLFNHKMKLMYRAISVLRKRGNLKLLHEDIETYYCFHPEYYHGELKAIPIPLFNNNDIKIKKTIADIFNVTSELCNIPQKYIFFSGIGDFEGEHPIGEADIVEKISDIVGKDNIIVKTHPRDKSGNFEKRGLKVLAKSTIPWEAIQLNGNFENKVFLSGTSGSVLGVNMMFAKKVKTLFLFRLCHTDGNTSISIAVDKFEELFAANCKDDDIYIVKNYDELVELLNETKIAESVECKKRKMVK